MRIADCTCLALLLLGWPAMAQEPPSAEPPPAEPSGAAGDEATRPAPLEVAAPVGPAIEFQIGADLFGGGLAGVDFIGGVNASLLYPLLDLLWVGIRPGLHYAFVDDGPYDQIWMHADAAVEINALDDPVRVYGLVAGGYSFALDSDFNVGLAHGYSVAGGVGVAWQPADFPAGLFLEAVFRYASASRSASRLVRDERGRPIYEPATLTWQTETFDRHFELVALTINLGLTVSP